MAARREAVQQPFAQMNGMSCARAMPSGSFVDQRHDISSVMAEEDSKDRALDTPTLLSAVHAALLP